MAADPPPQDAPPARAGRRGVLGWCLYDWANSPFATIVLTFVVPAYFARAVAADEAAAQASWGFTVGAAALAVAVLSPPLGAVADRTGGRKPWIGAFAAAMVAASALLWFVHPREEDAALLLALAFVGIVAFEVGAVFYNSMLPGLVPESRLGRVSGWAWGMGYIGGLAGLLVVLFLFVQADPPLLGLERGSAEHIRISGPVVAVWMAVFALPLFLWTPDPARPAMRTGAAAREGIAALLRDLRGLVRDPARRNLAWFLAARMAFTDGINTLFALGGIYAATTFGMETAEVILFGVLLNLTAGAGAFAFGWVDDRFGARATILVSLAALVVLGSLALSVDSKAWFIGLVAALGIFVGPVQSASRSLMARLAPPGAESEAFGLYALSGKATAFVGPWLVGAATLASGSQRWGMATIIPFLAVGGVMLLLKVRDPGGGRGVPSAAGKA